MVHLYDASSDLVDFFPMQRKDQRKATEDILSSCDETKLT